MLTLSAKIRKETGKKVKSLRKRGFLPGVLYGPGLESRSLEIESKTFAKTYKEAGQHSLITFELLPEKKKYLVLIHKVSYHPLTGEVLHIDFYQPSPEKKMEARVPLILEGEAPAVKESGGTLIKNMQEIAIRAFPKDLPKEFRVNIKDLKTFEDHIYIKDLKVTEGVEILREPEDIVVSIVAPEKVEEELEKPIEEKVEEVEKIEKEKKEEEQEINE